MRGLDFFENQKMLMQKNSAFLKKGCYVLHDNLRTYLHTSVKNQDLAFPQGDSGKKYAVRRFLGRAFFKVRISRNGESFSADAVYFATVPDPAYKDVKFFDFTSSDKKVLTLCANQKRYDLYMKNRALYKEKFPLPVLLMKDDDNLSYAEELVEGISWRGEKERERKTYRALFKFYCHRYAEDDGENRLPEADENRLLPTELQINDNIKMYLHHGDLSADNFKITSKGKLYFFDFDHAKMFPMYYDIFFLIFNEAIINGNFIGYELLKTGAFDEFFSGQSEKEKHLKAFLHRFWIVRLEGIVSNDHKMKFLNLYNRLMWEK